MHNSLDVEMILKLTAGAERRGDDPNQRSGGEEHSRGDEPKKQ